MTNVSGSAADVNGKPFAERYAHLDDRHPPERFKVESAIKWIDRGGILTRNSTDSTISTTTALITSLMEDEKHLADDIRLFLDELGRIHNRFVINKEIPLRQPRSYLTRPLRLGVEYLKFLDLEGSYSPPPRRMVNKKAKVASAPVSIEREPEPVEEESDQEIKSRKGIEVHTLPNGIKIHWMIEGSYTIADTKRIQAIMALKAEDFDFEKLTYQD